MTPDQAKAVAQTVGQQLQQEWMNTYKVIKAVPEDKKDYKHEFPRRLEKVLSLDGAKLAQELEFFGTKCPAVQYLVSTLTHMVHHRGQLTTYLRPMGGKVPSIYGGSFDEPWQG